MLNSGYRLFIMLWFLSGLFTAAASKLGKHLCSCDVPFVFSCPENMAELGQVLSLERGQLALLPSKSAAALPLKCCVLIRREAAKQEKEGWNWDSGTGALLWGWSTARSMMLAGLPSRDFHWCTQHHLCAFFLEYSNGR